MMPEMYKKGMFKDKRVTLMGLGLLGRGVGDAEFLAKEGAELIVTDLKSSSELKSSLTKLRKFRNISYTLGKHDFKDFEDRDFILKAAGVPLDSPYIAHARKKSIPIYMSTALLVSLTSAKIVGITGTRGKTTVTYLLYEILRAHAKGGKNKIFLGGNIRGVSTLAELPKAKIGDLFVLELDSWQLQGFGDLNISPTVAAFTTFMPDHLNYYKGDLKSYFKDKANIFKYQKAGDTFVAGSGITKLPKRALKVAGKDLPPDIALTIPGEHNLLNAAIAYKTAREMGVPHIVIKKALEKFKGVPGRLERVKSFKGITFYNDTTATTPHALKVALEALGQNKNVVLIAGGSNKQIDLEILKSPLRNFCKKVILLPGTGTDLLLKKKYIDAPILVKNMKEAVKQALKVSVKGDTVLLSPGFASFGLFKNEYDRGDQFLAAVKKL
jgi:UDP-N-acetylmuramoylalanine--D-glutamate ligase